MHHCIGTLGAFRACKQTLALHFRPFFRCLFCPIEETALSSIRACTRTKGTAPRPHLAIEHLTLWRGEPMYLHMMAEQRRTLRRQLLCHCCEANALTAELLGRIWCTKLPSIGLSGLSLKMLSWHSRQVRTTYINPFQEVARPTTPALLP